LGLPSFAAPDTWWQHRRASLLIMCDMGPAERARGRALHAAACDVEALRQAINLQESSAIMLERVHQTGKSRNARMRADHAPEMLLLALAEQEVMRAES
jgi:hypothetical protein